MNALPNWPRMMQRKTACAYCDLSLAAFEREVVAGTLPAPVILGNKEHWCRASLDRALDAITGQGVVDWRSKSPLYRNSDAA